MPQMLTEYLNFTITLYHILLDIKPTKYVLQNIHTLVSFEKRLWVRWHMLASSFSFFVTIEKAMLADCFISLGGSPKRLPYIDSSRETFLKTLA